MVKFALRTLLSLVMAVLFSGWAIAGCTPHISADRSLAETGVFASSPVSSSSPQPGQSIEAILQESWLAYKQRFVQADGRVIDWESDARTVSEAQAYAMLRAVWMDDADTFARTLNWAENNLQRKDPKTQAKQDSLWAWLWGRDDSGKWVIQDANFASDADVDAVTALILAARLWNRPDYLTIARTKLRDIWNRSTVTIKGDRYLLPGPAIAFTPSPNRLKFNPSYGSPAAFRLFAQIDPAHDWLSLVDSTYQLLQESAVLSQVKLPSDWVLLNTKKGQYEAIAPNAAQNTSNQNLQSIYSFDAYRVWWRVVLDAVWFDEPRAKAFLKDHLGHLQQLWQTQQRIPARIDLQGNAASTYEATAQYAMLYPAFVQVDGAIAAQIYWQKLMTAYHNGIWDNDSAYYVQNLAWFGLAAPTKPVARLLMPLGS